MTYAPAKRVLPQTGLDLPLSPGTEGELICSALQLSLVASQLRTAWHAGVIDSDSAMRSLDRAVREISDLRATHTK
jgi:hypothetical protein